MKVEARRSREIHIISSAEGEVRYPMDWRYSINGLRVPRVFHDLVVWVIIRYFGAKKWTENGSAYPLDG